MPAKQSQIQNQATLDPTDFGEVLKTLQPLIDFDCLSKRDDLCIHWDIRIVQGEDTPFARNKGSSSMPKALASNMVAGTPGMIEKEIYEKVLRPLVIAVYDKVGPLTAEILQPKNKSSSIHDEGGGAPLDKEADERGAADRLNQGE